MSRPTATAACLASPSAPCPGGTSGLCDVGADHFDHPRACLQAHVPAWRGVDYGRVSCCFRCCLSLWIRRFGLSANEAHWRSRGINHFLHNGAGGMRALDPSTGAYVQPPHTMPTDFVLHPRFAISRFAHFLAIERRDWEGLNESTPLRVLRSPQYRVPRLHAGRANGTLCVINGWGHSPATIARIASTLPAGPVALYYGDDSSWTASQLQAFHDAVAQAKRPLHHFAMNLDADAVRLPYVTHVPIGLNAAASELPRVLLEAGKLASRDGRHRTRELICCCQRPWPQRQRVFEQLRLAGHPHCNLSERRPYERLFHDYTRARFAVSAFGHGRTDFREWEILLAGGAPRLAPCQLTDHRGPKSGGRARTMWQRRPRTRDCACTILPHAARAPSHRTRRARPLTLVPGMACAGSRADSLCAPVLPVPSPPVAHPPCAHRCSGARHTVFRGARRALRRAPGCACD